MVLILLLREVCLVFKYYGEESMEQTPLKILLMDKSLDIIFGLENICVF